MSEVDIGTPDSGVGDSVIYGLVLEGQYGCGYFPQA